MRKRNEDEENKLMLELKSIEHENLIKFFDYSRNHHFSILMEFVDVIICFFYISINLKNKIVSQT